MQSKRHALGVEIGSRGIRAAIVDESAQVVDSARSIGAPANAQAIVEQTFRLIEQLLDRPRLQDVSLAAAGVAFGGPVDPQRGITIEGPRTSGFEAFPLAGLLEERLDLPVFLENDARAAALGEFRYGAGRGARALIFMQFGIGVGGGIILDGRLLHGAGMTAGEFGHMPVSAGGPRCSCGKPGHLEAYVSEPAVLRRWREASAERVGADATEVPTITIEEVFSRPEDPAAVAVAGEATQMIGMAVASLVTALSADMIVLGGYAARAGGQFVGAVRARVRQHALESASRRLTVSTTQLGAEASLLGVTSLAFDLVDERDLNGAVV